MIQGAIALVLVAAPVGLGLLLGDVYQHSHSLHLRCRALKHMHLKLLHGKVLSLAYGMWVGERPSNNAKSTVVTDA